jgi:hypothetical protein
MTLCLNEKNQISGDKLISSPHGEKKGTLIHCRWECKLVQPLWKSVRSFLKKLKIELPYDPTMPHLGIYPEELVYRGIYIVMLIATLFTRANLWDQPRCLSMDEWIKKV